MDVKQIILNSMDACERHNTGSQAALYLDQSMVTSGGYLPVMNLSGIAGYSKFSALVENEVAEYFGSDLGVAKQRVDEINSERGLTREQVIKMVAESMTMFNERRGGRY